jgi:hypothetical protein
LKKKDDNQTIIKLVLNTDAINGDCVNKDREKSEKADHEKIKKALPRWQQGKIMKEQVGIFTYGFNQEVKRFELIKQPDYQDDQ